MTVPRYEPNQPQQQSSTGTQSRGRGNRSPRDGYQYLKYTDIGTGNQLSGTIVEAHVVDDDLSKANPKPQMVKCKVTVGNNIFLYALRPSNPNLDTLTNAWSSDESKWTDKAVVWSVEENWEGRHNIVCTPKAETKGGRK